jgi:hypothetical protein
MANPYYRAYLLADLRRFPGWTEPDDHASLTDDSVVYLRDDHAVVRNPLEADQGVIWDTLTPQWLDYCQTTLRFEVPPELSRA